MHDRARLGDSSRAQVLCQPCAIARGGTASIYFNVQIPPRIRSVGAQVAEVLLVVAADL
jgi:hypothetical protein